LLLGLCALAGCAAMGDARVTCPLPGQEPLAIAELFFGRNVPGRGPVTDAEWSDFAARIIAQQFPDGFTVFDGEGQWLDQRTNRVLGEPTKILIAAADPESDLKSRIGAVVEAYRAQFHQRSVGVVTRTACAAF
jgi:Protein of unknown function (DUF3574)